MNAPFKPLIRSLAVISCLGLLLTGGGMAQAQSVPAPAGIVSWWPGEGNADDIVNGNNGTVIGNLGYAPGEVGQAFVFDDSTSYITVPPSPSLNVGIGEGFTIECWVQPNAFDVDVSGAPIIEWDSAYTDGLQFWTGGELFANLKDTNGVGHTLSALLTLNTNQFQHLALTYDRSSGYVFMYYNGVIVTNQYFGDITPQTTYPVNIGRRTGQPIGLYDTYGGLLDELSLYNRALTSNEIAAIYLAGGAGKTPPPPTPPAISSQPASLTEVAGQTAVFSVTAGGTPPLSYQWSFNGAPLDGATNAVLSLPDVQASNAGVYDVTVTNQAGSITSSNAVLTVNLPPVITVQPASQTVSNGVNVTFGVVAAGANLSYQWLFDGVPVVTGNTITTMAGNRSLGGSYAGDGGAATNAGLNYPSWDAVDGAGNLYIVDAFNSVIRKVTAAGIITTVAGNYNLRGGYSGDGGAATNAALNNPTSIAVDGAGNLYIADTHNNVIRKVDGTGRITTVAGNRNLGGGYSGDGGAATNAALDFPNGITVDGAGNLFFSEYYNNVVRKVNTSGIITTAAGKHSLGATYSGDGGAATNAGLSGPTGVSVDGSNNLYISDGNNNVIRQVNANGIITTVAGKHSLGAGYSGDGGPATNATMNHPNAVLVDGAGNLYISEYYNNVVRLVNAAGIISTFAGNRSLGGGYSGDGGPATNAAFNLPLCVALDSLGNFYICDAHNNVVREVSAAPAASSTNSTLTLTDVQPAMAGNYQVIVSNPAGSVTSSNASLWVWNPPVITAQPANLTVFAGQTAAFSVKAGGGAPLNYQWIFNGAPLNGATNAGLSLADVQGANGGVYQVTVTNQFGSVTSSNAVLTVILPPVITVQPASQTVSDGANTTMGVTATGADLSYQWLFDGLPVVAGNVITTVTGNPSLGGSYAGDGGAATNAGLYYPAWDGVDAAGNLYVVDTFNNVIRKVTAAGLITTVAGNKNLGGGYSGDGGAATNAALNLPDALALDGAGNLYIADAHNNVIRKVDGNGRITTVAGNYHLGAGHSGDGGAATNAALNFPTGLTVDGAGNLFISEYFNNDVRKVAVSGIITTVAGNPSLGGGYSGNGGPATNAALNVPTGVAVDGSNNLYISEGGNHDVRKVDARGIITTVAGNPSLGGGYSGDGGAATNAAMNHPNAVTVDGAGNLYIPEYYNNVVRLVNAAGIISTYAGNHNLGGGCSGDGGPATNAALNNPVCVALDSAGNLYICDAHNNVIRKGHVQK